MPNILFIGGSASGNYYNVADAASQHFVVADKRTPARIIEQTRSASYPWEDTDINIQSYQKIVYQHRGQRLSVMVLDKMDEGEFYREMDRHLPLLGGDNWEATLREDREIWARLPRPPLRDNPKPKPRRRLLEMPPKYPPQPPQKA